MRSKKALVCMITLAIMLLIVTGCSAPAKTEETGAKSGSSEAAVTIPGLPDDFPQAAVPLIVKDPEITDATKGSDGKTFTVMFKTSLTLDEAHAFYADKMKDFENFTETKNEFGYVFQGSEGDNSFTVAISHFKDSPANAVLTVY